MGVMTRVRHVWQASLVAGTLCLAIPLAAHHAGAVQYDPTRPVTLTGTISAIEWRYPHQGFTLDVEDARGEVATWEFVLEGPNNALRRGWTRTSLAVGDVVTVKGFQARDRPLEARAVDMTRSDGRPLIPASR